MKEISPGRYRESFGRYYEEFVDYNKLYCAVSGSLISPGSMPEFLYVNQDKSNTKICGYYYRCCIPCSCDVMKYSNVKKINYQFKDLGFFFFYYPIFFIFRNQSPITPFKK